MGTAAKARRENRTITVDLQNEATYVELLGDGKAFLECVMAFLLALDFQLTHKATCAMAGVSHATLIMPVSGWVGSSTQSYGEFQRAAVHQEPSYRVKGILTDGFDSTTRRCEAPTSSSTLHSNGHQALP
jgi:hypothetical protein